MSAAGNGDGGRPVATSHCGSCGARIIWTRTEKGKRMPVDAVSMKRLILVEDPDKQGVPVAKMVDTFVSHFATCPNAAQHRRRR